MMLRSRKWSRAVCLTIANLGFGTLGCASLTVEEWKTSIPCGGKQFTLTSFCKASGDPFELNTCRPGQKLTNGSRSVALPATPRDAKLSPLFATHWQCVMTEAAPYLVLDFATGTGRSSSDESVEFYDMHLQVVTDESTIRGIYKRSGKAPNGFVKSIFPGEGN